MALWGGCARRLNRDRKMKEVGACHTRGSQAGMSQDRVDAAGHLFQGLTGSLPACRWLCKAFMSAAEDMLTRLPTDPSLWQLKGRRARATPPWRHTTHLYVTEGNSFYHPVARLQVCWRCARTMATCCMR